MNKSIVLLTTLVTLITFSPNMNAADHRIQSALPFLNEGERLSPDSPNNPNIDAANYRAQSAPPVLVSEFELEEVPQQSKANQKFCDFWGYWPNEDSDSENWEKAFPTPEEEKDEEEVKRIMCNAATQTSPKQRYKKGEPGKNKRRRLNNF